MAQNAPPLLELRRFYPNIKRVKWDFFKIMFVVCHYKMCSNFIALIIIQSIFQNICYLLTIIYRKFFMGEIDININNLSSWYDILLDL